MISEGRSRVRRQLGEVAVVLAFLALAGLVFQQTGTSFVEQGAATGGAMFNAAMFPELMAWGLILLSALQLVGIIRALVAGTPADAAADQDGPAGSADDSRLSVALVCAALFVLYLFLLKPLGYHLTTPLFLFAFYYVLGTRRILVAIALGLATSLAMSFVFEYGMNVILPVGMFGIGF